MNKYIKTSGIVFILILLSAVSFYSAENERETNSFNKSWKFYLGDVNGGQKITYNDSKWRELNLPHDWSIEGEFSDDNPATYNGGALPGGIGWYRKEFVVSEKNKNKSVFIDFDGIYKDSEVWINEHYLGKRPYGYISFRYELTPYLNYGDKKNIIAVKVDNSRQPNSRWYSGSGIYRNVWIVFTNKISVDHWGTYVTTPEVTEKSAKVNIETKIRNQTGKNENVVLKSVLIGPEGNEVAQISSPILSISETVQEVQQEIEITNPQLWSIENPALYKVVSKIEYNGKICDEYETPIGIRYFKFDQEKGFFLNGKHVKIKGVCNHHDLGCLGAAINTRALERQLELLKEMGCNGIRTSHNPPAPELLDLCDKMGFIVMDEAFDMWKMSKTKFDYSLDWDDWHKRDLIDFITRDRNHPSIFIWSIGNEIQEQRDSSGTSITKALCDIVRSVDNTRPITSGSNKVDVENYIIKSEAQDIIGINYHHGAWLDLPNMFKGKPFILAETTSSIHTRGYYDLPSDSIRVWTHREPEKTNTDLTCSAYDNCHVPWGSRHETSWLLLKKHDYLTGMYIWTGFDYLGEPTPYKFPARSSYFGILDLCGFPKDAYYMYQSEWTQKPVLHIFPHWNWTGTDSVDVWAYSNADAVELFLNEVSLGVKNKVEDKLHLVWRVAYAPGTLKAISRTNEKEVLTKEITTAGKPAKIILSADRNIINADGSDLSFVTVKVVDKDGTLVPNADNLITFKVDGEGLIAGVDNGSPISSESFKANYRKAMNGLCLVVIQSKEKKGSITLTATSENLESAIEKIITE